MKVGFACGVFDLYHAGHARMLEECRSNCDFLIVALNKAENLPAGKNIPVFSIEERVEILKSCKFVDEVLVYNSENELLDLMKGKKIDVRFLGEDYRSKPITGAELKIPVYYINRDHGYSTTALIKRIVERYSK